MERLGKHLDITATSLEQSIDGVLFRTPREALVAWAILHLQKSDLYIKGVRIINAPR